MALIVQKYGGTSVGTPERIRLVAQRIAKSRQQGNQMVIVVSAMGHTTDELIDLAHQVSKTPPHREMDMLLTVGERISMALLSMALADCQIPALSLTGSQTGIITDPSHRRARIQRILGNRVRAALDENKVVIVAGFQGVSETKEITTLGRGGSDTSAVALAAALNAAACEIYTDVDGVFSADPRKVPGARLWKRIPHDLMVEMAVRGAGVLHPRSVELAKQYRVPLWVKNSFKEAEGTAVISGESKSAVRGMEEFSVTGVTTDLDKFWIELTLKGTEALPLLWKKAGQSHLTVMAPVFAQKSVSFFTDRDSEAEWQKILKGLVHEGRIQDYRMNQDLVPLSIIGDRFSQDSMALLEVMETLEKEEVPVSLGSSSTLVMTLGVPVGLAEKGVQSLHRKLIEGQRNA